jgi:ABC-2 type transport system ATP-binding protein
LRFLADARGGVAKKRIDELAERFSLDTTRQIRSLSKGNKQKVGLVQAFMHEPELLILDEPTSGLDPLMQQEFLQLVREARDAGQTVFMSSHVLAEVQESADRVGIVRDGRLIALERVESLGKRAVRHVQVHFDAPVPTARRLSISARAVTCRLDRVQRLTGYAATDPTQRFTLEAAVLGARLLDWPRKALS